MRIVLLLTVLALSGCDAFSEADVDLMRQLDGVWTLTVATERIGSDGTVTPEGTADPVFFEVGRRVECATREFENVAEEDRIAATYSDPNGGRTCDVLTADSDAERIVFVGDGDNLTDRVGTIREASATRQVWDFYAPQADRSTLRFRWTLTRS